MLALSTKCSFFRIKRNTNVYHIKVHFSSKYCFRKDNHDNRFTYFVFFFMCSQKKKRMLLMLWFQLLLLLLLLFLSKTWATNKVQTFNGGQLKRWSGLHPCSQQWKVHVEDWLFSVRFKFLHFVHVWWINFRLNSMFKPRIRSGWKIVSIHLIKARHWCECMWNSFQVIHRVLSPLPPNL